VLSIRDRSIRHVQRRHVDSNFFRGHAQFLVPASKLAGASGACRGESGITWNDHILETMQRRAVNSAGWFDAATGTPVSVVPEIAHSMSPADATSTFEPLTILLPFIMGQSHAAAGGPWSAIAGGNRDAPIGTPTAR
jgi:hypothetical protein